MFDHERLFTAALQLADPIYVQRVEFDESLNELHLYLDFCKGGRFACPECGRGNLSVHDTIEKVWRHLNFFQYKAFIHFRTPRVVCPEHGVRLVDVPWAAPGSGFTLLFEAFVLQLAQVMPMLRIALRYVDRARLEANYSAITKVGVDETSSKRRHTYVTLFVDMEESRVVHVCEGKDSGAVQSFKQMLESKEIDPQQVTDFSADMSIPFRKGIQEAFPTADLTFDKFHVMKLMNEALNNVRRQEQKEESALKRSRYLWLSNECNLRKDQVEKLATLSSLNLKTARAYRIKLALQDVYARSADRNDAERLLEDWHQWASRSRIDAIRSFASTVRSNWTGILNYFNSRLTNAILESINSIIQSARNRAKGYRNVRTFISIIYLLAGKLNLEFTRTQKPATHSI